MRSFPQLEPEPAGTTAQEVCLLSQRCIWAAAPHNAFTDLAFHEGRLLCCFREGESHVSMDGRLRVLGSADGETWLPLALLEVEPGADLRDPHFAHSAAGGLLLLAAVRRVEGGIVRYRSLVWHARSGTGGRGWSAPREVGEAGHWLWRAAEHRGRLWSVAYSVEPERFGTYLYSSADGNAWRRQPGPPLVAGHPAGEAGYPNETDLVFRETGVVAVTRRDATERGFPTQALLGTAASPRGPWSWRELGRRFGSPRLLALPDGRLLAAGRLYGPTRCVLADLDAAAGTITELLVLAEDRDCAYPGLALCGAGVWVSYYSGHDTRAAIYVARVALPGGAAKGEAHDRSDGAAAPAP